jgi:DNA-binding NtrC family response regulator
MQDRQDWKLSPSILVIDDEAAVCEGIRRVLHGEGYEVTTTCSPRDGIDLLRKKSFDLLLLDIKMPELNGMKVLQESRASSPNTEVVIITGYATIETAIDAIRQGAFEYLQKPVGPEKLLITVARALERRHLLDLTQRLRSELESRHRIGRLVCSSPKMQKVMQLVAKVAPTNSTILISGDTGTGKDCIAKAIHYNSPRKDEPFIVADCSALNESLLESELFGHVRGAFTGAVRNREGLVEAARGSTLFLDEIATLSPRIQSSLLRLLQEREIRPVGSDKTVSVDVRVIAATNKDLLQLVEAGTFREDLYYRLAVFTISLPALRDRIEEVPLLSHHFLEKYAEEFEKQINGIRPRALSALEVHDWPGNVRELENVIERAVLLTDTEFIDVDALPTILGEHSALEAEDTPVDARSLALRKKELRAEAVERLEKLFVIRALQQSQWNVTQAALGVDMQRPNFHALMRKYGIAVPRVASNPAGRESSTGS